MISSGWDRAAETRMSHASLHHMLSRQVTLIFGDCQAPHSPPATRKTADRACQHVAGQSMARALRHSQAIPRPNAPGVRPRLSIFYAPEVALARKRAPSLCALCLADRFYILPGRRGYENMARLCKFRRFQGGETCKPDLRASGAPDGAIRILNAHGCAGENRICRHRTIKRAVIAVWLE